MRYISISDTDLLEGEGSFDLDNSLPQRTILNVVDELREKNRSLKDEVIFLRKQILTKDDMLSKLIGLAPLLQNNLMKDVKDVEMDLREMMAFLIKQVQKKNTIDDADEEHNGSSDFMEQMDEMINDISPSESNISTPNISRKRSRNVTVRKPKPKISYAIR